MQFLCSIFIVFVLQPSIRGLLRLVDTFIGKLTQIKDSSLLWRSPWRRKIGCEIVRNLKLQRHTYARAPRACLSWKGWLLYTLPSALTVLFTCLIYKLLYRASKIWSLPWITLQLQVLKDMILIVARHAQWRDILRHSFHFELGIHVIVPESILHYVLVCHVSLSTLNILNVFRQRRCNIQSFNIRLAHNALLKTMWHLWTLSTLTTQLSNVQIHSIWMHINGCILLVAFILRWVWVQMALVKAIIFQLLLKLKFDTEILFLQVLGRILVQLFDCLIDAIEDWRLLLLLNLIIDQAIKGSASLVHFHLLNW